MIIDRSHRAWAGITTVIAVIAAVLYYVNYHTGMMQPSLHDTRGGTVLGTSYGVVSFLIFVFAALLGWRRKHPSWRLGRLQFWMKGHIWLTFLTVPLIFMHAGFRFGGFQTSLLMWIYLIVMASGVVGLVLQHILPRIMQERLPDEVVFEQIPFLLDQIRGRARALRESIDEALKPATAPEPAEATAGGGEVPAEIHSAPQVAPGPPIALMKGMDAVVLPYLDATRGDSHPLGDQRSSKDFFLSTRVQTEAKWHPLLDQIEDLVEERRRLDLQTKLQHWLHGWILAHAPFSFLLLLLTCWHIGVVLFAY